MKTDGAPTAVAVGDMVLWKPDHNADGRPAIVSGVSNLGRLNLAVIEKDSVGLFVIESCPHESSSDIRPDELEETGVWAESPTALRIKALQAELEEVKLSLAGAIV